MQARFPFLYSTEYMKYVRYDLLNPLINDFSI